MELLNRMTAFTILSDEVLDEVFEEQDEIRKARLLLSLEDRAKELGVKSKFEKMVKAYQKRERQMRRDYEQDRREKNRMQVPHNFTNFTGDYPAMYCGTWIADDSGVYVVTTGEFNQCACYHPILPVERFKNLETGEEQIKIAYKRNNAWHEIIVPKTMVTSASKIVALSGRGIAVTSETAKLLVKYLADVENMNETNINVCLSSSKLGWSKDGHFLPYDIEITFDGDGKFQQLHDSIHPTGSREAWYELVKSIRSTRTLSVSILLAASFASVLVGKLEALPFIVDLWGETEGGKTVTLMLAASVWANPSENCYIGDFKSTDVGLEVRADCLNSLPMILDDTSKVSERIRDKFESIIYDLCSGKGKTRSNKDLGVNREFKWKNAILCNGERPLQGYVSQGGAINRILEVEADRRLFDNPQNVVRVISGNFGHAGMDFINVLRKLDIEQIRGIYNDFIEQLKDDEKMQKQSMSLAIILTADKIVTDYLFKDGIYLPVVKVKDLLSNHDDISDNARCYRYLLDKISMNTQRFDIDTKCEKWGIIEKGIALFYTQAFRDLCEIGGYSDKSFLAWAKKHKVILTDKSDGSRTTKVKKINGRAVRCVWLKMEEPDENDGFVDAGQVELPF